MVLLFSLADSRLRAAKERTSDDSKREHILTPKRLCKPFSSICLSRQNDISAAAAAARQLSLRDISKGRRRLELQLIRGAPCRRRQPIGLDDLRRTC